LINAWGQVSPKSAIRESAQYCLRHGTPDSSYIYSSSNTIFPDMQLEHYEYMLDVFRELNQEKGK
jgi:uroporphyrinogen-III decarboxylase